jgi:hypothetical protein
MAPIETHTDLRELIQSIRRGGRTGRINKKRQGL